MRLSNHKSVIKCIIAVILLIAIVFGGVNLFWYGFKYLPYKKMADKMQFNNDSEMPRYLCTDDQYMYRLKMPGYLSFTSGFLYVGPNDEEAAVLYADDDGSFSEANKPHVDMFVWPQIFSETQYGITIYEETYSMQFMMNGQGELIPDENMTDEERAEAIMMFEKHKDEIRDIIRAAAELWGDELN